MIVQHGTLLNRNDDWVSQNDEYYQNNTVEG
jgi:hypothetical protein